MVIILLACVLALSAVGLVCWRCAGAGLRQVRAEGLVAELTAALARSNEQLSETTCARRRAEVEMQQSERRCCSLLQGTTSIAWDMSASGEFETEQPGWSAFTGQTFDQLRGWGWLEAVHPDDRPHTAQVWSAAVTNQALYLAEHRLRRHDGEYWLMLGRAAPILNEDGTVRQWAGLHTTTTQQSGYEVALGKARDVADAANRAKSEFLANMSHEIRSPMNAILGMTELALDTDLDPAPRDYLETVHAAAEALLAIINDILDFSKIEAGKLELDPVEFCLRDAVAAGLKPLAFRAFAKELELVYRVDPAVPALLVGDCGRLVQILVNLVGNGVKFTERGEVVVGVTVEGPQADAGGEHPAEVTLHFTISDTGIGIEADKRDLIFHAFVQADGSTTRKFGGTGLGLSICKQLVTRMGGRIWVESEVGRGTTFHFTAPLGWPAQPMSAGAPPELRDLVVLVVDDNAASRLTLSETLRSWGMRPEVAEDGPAGLAILRGAARMGWPFSLAVIDLMMPGMDGFAVAREISQDASLTDTPVLVLSSIGLAENDARFQNLVFARGLTKPIRQSDLLEAIQAVLCSRGDAAGCRFPVRAKRTSPPASVRPIDILLAEDNAFNQHLALLTLGRQHNVHLASNGRDAVAALDERPFDLILMDVQMPVMDGLEATATIRAREQVTGRHVPIIALTAHAIKGARERFLNAGMDGYVSKPIRTEEFWAQVKLLVPHLLREDPAEDAAPPAQPLALDLEGALERVGGDHAALHALSGVFREDSGKLLADAAEAIRAGDAERLARDAHTLKGSLQFFNAASAVEAALRLEAIGRQADLSEAPQTLEDVGRELDQLLAVLARET